MRSSTIFFLFITINLTLLAALTLHARHGERNSSTALAASGELVKKLRLSDLCLFTEARYTRHPAMADLHSAFQDHPFAMDHFPSGSLVSPPRFHHESP
jgi:hypothetical protein